MNPAAYHRFDRRGAIVVAARITGPVGVEFARLMLDTGAAFSALPTKLLEAIGYSRDMPEETRSVITVSGLERVRVLRVERLEALAVARDQLLVLAHDLPAESGLDGLLGLDFLRDLRLTIDFRAGTISLG